MDIDMEDIFKERDEKLKKSVSEAERYLMAYTKESHVDIAAKALEPVFSSLWDYMRVGHSPGCECVPLMPIIRKDLRDAQQVWRGALTLIAFAEEGKMAMAVAVNLVVNDKVTPFPFRPLKKGTIEEMAILLAEDGVHPTEIAARVIAYQKEINSAAEAEKLLENPLAMMGKNPDEVPSA